MRYVRYWLKVDEGALPDVLVDVDLTSWPMLPRVLLLLRTWLRNRIAERFVSNWVDLERLNLRLATLLVSAVWLVSFT